MTRTLSIALATLLSLVLISGDLFAHGGSFRGPSGGVPPGLREPSDPEPPPPPPSDPGDPGGPTTPGDNPTGPTTPEGLDGPSTGGGAPPPSLPPSTPSGPATGGKTASLTFESWRFWWAYNSDDILNLKSSIYGKRVSTHSPLFFSSKDDESNRTNPTRATQAAITSQIIPALERRLNAPRDHEDIHGGALIALGKVGTADMIGKFKSAMYNRYKTDSGQKVKFGYQATESGLLALGMLPDLEASAIKAIREICIEAIQDDKLRTRERPWAAVVLGLQRDADAVEPLMKLLEVKYSDENIPAGILTGIGLIGSQAHDETKFDAVPELAEAFVKGKLRGRELSPRTHAFVGYALSKLEDPRALPAINKVLKSRSTGSIVKRSAAISAGTIGAKADPEMRDQTVQRLLSFIRKTGDPSSQNFATIALSQLATPKAIKALMDFAADGKYGQRPFAGLGLATLVFYKDRAAKAGGEGLDSKTRNMIVDHLRKLSIKFKPKDMKAAFMLARGIVRDKTAVEVLVMHASKRAEDPVLRGFACVALGLIGDGSDDVKEAIMTALDSRKSAALKVHAATGLGLLDDAGIVKLLIDQLKGSKSFAVQGQLIQAIGKIGDHTAIIPLIEILDDTKKPAQTRAMASVGLGMIGDLRQYPVLSRLAKNYNYRASVPDMDELLFIL